MAVIPEENLSVWSSYVELTIDLLLSALQAFTLSTKSMKPSLLKSWHANSVKW